MAAGAMEVPGLGRPEPLRLMVTAMGDEPLIGVAALRHFMVVLDHGSSTLVRL